MISPAGALPSGSVSRHSCRPSLSGRVACYFAIEAERGDAVEVRAIPDGCADLLIDLRAARGWLGRPRVRATVFRHAPPVCLLGAQLLPGAAHLLEGADLSPLVDRARAAVDLPGRLAALDEFLDEAFTGRAIDPRVERALHAIGDRGGTISVEALARVAGASARNLQRLMLAWVGLTPKRLGRIHRFQAVLSAARAGTTIDWAGLALELGYSDQSHLVRDVAAFAGLPPSALRRPQSGGSGGGSMKRRAAP